MKQDMEKHSPLPWEAFDRAGVTMRSYSQSSGVKVAGKNQIVCGCFMDIGGEDVAAANAAFITLAVNTFHEREGRIEELEEALSDLLAIIQTTPPDINDNVAHTTYCIKLLAAEEVAEATLQKSVKEGK